MSTMHTESRIHFRLTNSCSYESVDVFEIKYVLTRGIEIEPQHSYYTVEV